MLFPGLEQTFNNKNGKQVKLKDVLREGDWWELKKRKSVVYIVTHDGVKRVASEAGIQGDPEYKILTQPEVGNNYTYLIQVKITDDKGRSTIDLGESSRSNLGSRGRNNPANMAQKRAFDRAVFNHLGITGLLGEDELPDEEELKPMDKLTLDEQKQISPYLNEIFAVKNKTDLLAFRAKMKKVEGLNEGQLEVLRNLWKKKLASLEKSF